MYAIRSYYVKMGLMLILKYFQRKSLLQFGHYLAAEIVSLNKQNFKRLMAERNNFV